MAGNITESLNALAAKIDGGTVTGAPDIKGAVDLVKEKYVPMHQAAHQADSTATDAAGLVTDFNALLAKLIAAGVMEDE